MYAQAGHSVPKPLFTPGHNPSQQEVNWVGTHSNRFLCMPLANTKLLGRPLPRYWPVQCLHRASSMLRATFVSFNFMWEAIISFNIYYLFFICACTSIATYQRLYLQRSRRLLHIQLLFHFGIHGDPYRDKTHK